LRLTVRAALTAGSAALLLGASAATGAPGKPAAAPAQPSFPLRAAFYYPWYPESWRQRGYAHFTRYTPTLGFYDSANPNVIRRHVRAMLWGGIRAGISSWWGRGHRTDARLSTLMTVSAQMKARFWWSLYYEPEGQGDPSSSRIHDDLVSIKTRFGARPNYLRVGKRFVVFVYSDPNDGCDMVRRWKEANTVGAYLVMRVFNGYRSCTIQPDAWHQYAPATPTQGFPPDSFSISPEFSRVDEPAPRLQRDLTRWRASIRQMIDSHARFQLITTFNEWGEGTAVESAQAWQSASGFGAFLDTLHANGAETPPAAAGKDPVIVAAGDISCDPGDGSFKGGAGTSENCRQGATSDLALSLNPDAVLTLGDHQYEDSTYDKFLRAFAPSWGRLKALIRPAIGNHEYITADAAGYFQYFGAAAGDPTRGYYSYDLGGWHILSLNSECSHVGGCGPGSTQEKWLLADLAAHPSTCALAYWHEPRFSSGQHGDAQQMTTLWNDLVAAHVDVVLQGHNHDYERFEPLGATPSGAKYQSPNLDPRGIRAFVVGTGGKNHYAFASAPLAGEVVRNSDTYGVLKLTLHPTGYDWAFVPEPGKGFTDAGSGTCN
jgi:hypothetical protein